MKIVVKRFDKKIPLPEYNEGAACFDFTCSEEVTIPPHQIKAVRQNVAVKVPEGFVLLVFSRSSTPLRKGLVMANGVGVIDPFYCGDKDEILVFLLNITDENAIVEAGDKIAQGMIIKTESVSWNEVDKMPEVGIGGYRHSDEIK